MRWPIGAHWCARAYPQARDLGFGFCWLAANGLSADPRSREIADTDGFLLSPMDYVLLFHLSDEARLLNLGETWTRHVSDTYDRLQSLGLLGRCVAVQLDDEFFTNEYVHRGMQAMHDAGPHVAARADDVRRIFGGYLGQGVGMSETGAVLPPTRGIDWWGLDLYLGPGYYDRASTVARLYAAAVSLGRPIMPVLPLFVDGNRTPPTLDTLARCYLPLLEQHAASIFAVGVFALHHPSVYAPDLHRAGRGVLELSPAYAAGVRVLTELYGRN